MLWLIAFHAVLAVVAFVLARRRPWTLVASLPLILVGQFIVFGEWWFQTADYVIRAAALAVPILGALSRLGFRRKAGRAGAGAG